MKHLTINNIYCLLNQPTQGQEKALKKMFSILVQPLC